MQIGNQIKTQRALKHWSQQELAEQLHISRQSISKWEQGTALPSFENIILLSDLFQISIDSLIRQDPKLMNHLTHPIPQPLSFILLISWGLALLGASTSLGLGINATTFTTATQSLVLFGMLGMLIVIYLQHRRFHRYLPWILMGIAIATLTLLLIPQVDSIFQGFWDGLR